MIYKEIPIGDALLRTYVLSNYNEIDAERRRAFILICPGGAYRFCSNREAEAVAIRFNSLGCNCGVLFYSTNHDEYNVGNVYSTLFPKPQDELSEAVAYIRANSNALNTNPDKIAVMGFSAGGHLAASLGVMWRHYGERSKPNALVLCYPVITSGPLAHVESIRRLVGTNEALLEKVSLEKQISKDTPPTFIWTTRTDQSVPYENSVMFVQALERNNVPVRFKLYEEGGHGLSLGTQEVYDASRAPVKAVQDWPEQADSFLTMVFGSKY